MGWNMKYNIEAERLFACSTNRGILFYPLKMDFAERSADLLQNLRLFLGGELVSMCSFFFSEDLYFYLQSSDSAGSTASRAL